MVESGRQESAHSSRGLGGATLEDLIRVTEQRVIAEQQGARLLGTILDKQDLCVTAVDVNSEHVRELQLAIGRLEAMVIGISEYLAALAGRDHREVAEIRERLLNGLAKHPPAPGVSFGDSADVDIGGDMVGGDQQKGR